MVWCNVVLVVGGRRDDRREEGSSMRNGGEDESTSLGRNAVHLVLFAITGGVALSALDDLSIYHSCSSKAMEKVSKNKVIIDALGGPIVKGPWYNASLSVAHKRHSVSCSFPLSGRQGTCLLQIKAVRNGDDSWFSFFLPRDWDILIMDALLHVPGNEEKHQTLRIIFLTSCLLLVLHTLPLSANPVHQRIQRQNQVRNNNSNLSIHSYTSFYILNIFFT
ncbi:hypothetical protein L6164_034348 [Bauhinia variegata]|uniref:Uncharacterized protein n=1 Tax=Bauhinia variegata TaxID=167791 RepID=A0ACB9KV25_BAUVA|nr:hypothetical protein L6164_034348 [Bauhinia variegata]